MDIKPSKIESRLNRKTSIRHKLLTQSNKRDGGIIKMKIKINPIPIIMNTSPISSSLFSKVITPGNPIIF